MIDCDKAMEFISEYIEKRLTPGLKTELNNHFQQCSDCKLILERIPKVQSLISNMPAVKCSEDFNSKLREKIAGNQNESLLTGDSFKKLSYGFSFAVIILAMVFGFNFFDQANTETEIQLPQVQRQESSVPSSPANQNFQQASTNMTEWYSSK